MTLDEIIIEAERRDREDPQWREKAIKRSGFDLDKAFQPVNVEKITNSINL